MGNRTRWRLAAVAAVILARLAVVGFAHSLDLYDDSGRYLQEGINLWSHGTFSQEPGPNPQPTAHDLPLFPLTLAGYAAVWKSAALAGRTASVVNCFLYGIAAWGVYRWSMLLTQSEPVSWLALAIFALPPEPDSIVCSACYMPEPLFLALLVWSLVHFTRFLRGGSGPALGLSFVLWALGVLAKPISLYFGPVVAALAWYFVWRAPAPYARRAAWVGLSFLLGISILTPWSVRNYLRFGDAGLSSITGENLFEVNYRFLLRDTPGVDAESTLRKQEAEAYSALGEARNNPMHAAAALGGIAKHEILAHPVRYLYSTLKRHPRLYTQTAIWDLFALFGDSRDAAAASDANDHSNLTDWGAWMRTPLRVAALQCFFEVANLLFYALAVLGIWKMMKLPDRIPAALLLAELAYFAVAIGPNTVIRYRMTMLPALVIAAAYGIAALAGRLHAFPAPSQAGGEGTHP